MPADSSSPRTPITPQHADRRGRCSGPWLKQLSSALYQADFAAPPDAGVPLCPVALEQNYPPFLDDGGVRSTTTLSSAAIRPLALNRKNALFAGSDGGAEHWAVIASLIETCKLLAVEPHGYLADVITRIVNGHPQTRLDDLMPWAYPAAPAFKP